MRRSVRSFSGKPLTLSDVSQLLFAAQGITGKGGFRTAPSAGALYPIEIIIASGNVEGLPAGIYRYVPENHYLVKMGDGDKRMELSHAALGQQCIREGPLLIIITGIVERTRIKYGSRAERYVYMEAGHVSQNIYLQAEALDMGTVAVGAFDDKQCMKVLGLPEKERPLYMMPVGKSR